MPLSWPEGKRAEAHLKAPRLLGLKCEGPDELKPGAGGIREKEKPVGTGKAGVTSGGKSPSRKVRRPGEV